LALVCGEYECLADAVCLILVGFAVRSLSPKRIEELEDGDEPHRPESSTAGFCSFIDHVQHPPRIGNINRIGSWFQMKSMSDVFVLLEPTGRLTFDEPQRERL
jgi:hypothetical protein